MNKYILIASGLLLSATAGVVAFKAGKSCGKKSAVNKLRDEQLAQAKEEYLDRISTFEGTLGDLNDHYQNASDWLKAEEDVINSMYDDIINNL